MGPPPMGPTAATAPPAAPQLKTNGAPDDVAAPAPMDATGVSPRAGARGAAPAQAGASTADAPSEADGKAVSARVPAVTLSESGSDPRLLGARRKRPRPVDATDGVISADKAPSSPPSASPSAGGRASAIAAERSVVSAGTLSEAGPAGGAATRGDGVGADAPVRAPKRSKPLATTASGDDGGAADGGGGVAGAATANGPSPASATLLGVSTTPDGGPVGGATAATATAGGGTAPPGTTGRVTAGDQPPPPDGRDGVAGDDSAGAPLVIYNREHNLSAVFGSSSGSKAAGSPGSAGAAAGGGSGPGADRKSVV